MCFRCTETLAGGCPRTPERHPRAMSTGTEMSRFGVVPEKGAERRGRIAGQIARAGLTATAGR